MKVIIALAVLFALFFCACDNTTQPAAPQVSLPQTTVTGVWSTGERVEATKTGEHEYVVPMVNGRQPDCVLLTVDGKQEIMVGFKSSH